MDVDVRFPCALVDPRRFEAVAEVDEVFDSVFTPASLARLPLRLRAATFFPDFAAVASAFAMVLLPVSLFFFAAEGLVVPADVAVDLFFV